MLLLENLQRRVDQLENYLAQLNVQRQTNPQLQFVVPNQNHYGAVPRRNIQHNRRGHAIPTPSLDHEFTNNTAPRYTNLVPAKRHESENHETDKKHKQPYSYLGFKCLNKLTQMDPEKILIELANVRNGFVLKLEEDLSGDYLVLIIKVLAKMCSSAFNANKATIIGMVAKENFLTKVRRYVMELAVHELRDKKRNRLFWENMDQFWNDLHAVCSAIIDLIPSTAVIVLPKLLNAIKLTTENFKTQHSIQVSNEIVKRFEVLQEKLSLHIADIEKKQVCNCNFLHLKLLHKNGICVYSSGVHSHLALEVTLFA